MVAFLTLLLGLTVGEQRIELAVDDRVASVELLLDGNLVARLRGQPWQVDVDFGEALLPHHLEAIARDAAGGRVGAALQRVNLPREVAEATLRLLGSPSGGYREAELGWRAADESSPEEIRVLFDGEPLEVEGRRVALPSHDLRTVHVLAAELLFAHQVRATVELAFGGEFGETVKSELTAVPLELAHARELPSGPEVERWLRVGEASPRVVAVERGPLELIVVRGDASLPSLRTIGRQTAGRGPRRSSVAPLRMSAGIGLKDVLRLVDTHPALVPAPDGKVTALFPITADVNGPNRGIGWALTNLFFTREGQPERELLTEAVAVGALRAAASNRTRALVLVTSSKAEPAPAAGLAAANVRGFAEALRVPFFHWQVGPRDERSPDAWGEPLSLQGIGGVRVAVRELMEALEPQFVVWLDGLHKPDDVELGPDAPPGLRLAGTVPVSVADSRPSRRASPAGAG